MGWSARTFPADWRPKIGPISPEHLNVGTRGGYMQPCLQQRNILADVLTQLRDAVASVCAAAAGVYSSLGWPPRASPPLGAGTNSRRDRAAVCRWAVRRWLTEYDDLGSGTGKRVPRVMLGLCGVLQSLRVR